MARSGYQQPASPTRVTRELLQYAQRDLLPNGSGWKDLLDGLNACLKIVNYHAFEPRALQGNQRSPFDGKRGSDGKKTEAKKSPTAVATDSSPATAELPPQLPGMLISALDQFHGHYVNLRNREDLAYWLLDNHYDGSNFTAQQFFFCGGDGDEFDGWHKDLRDLANSKAKRKQEAEKTLRIEIDEEAFEWLYGFVSHPIPYQPGRKLAIRVISQFGEECTKVLTAV